MANEDKPAKPDRPEKIPGGGENVSLGSDIRTQLYKYIKENRKIKNRVLREAIEDFLVKVGYWPIGI